MASVARNFHGPLPRSWRSDRPQARMVDTRCVRITRPIEQPSDQYEDQRAKALEFLGTRWLLHPTRAPAWYR
jgi:hypothetical protein